MSKKLQLTAVIEEWPIIGDFRISRGAKTKAEIILVTISDGEFTGRGECVPYGRYGETLEGVREAILDMHDPVTSTMCRKTLLELLPPGAARNAIDCALWDYEAKAGNIHVSQLARTGPLKSVTTAYTISLDTPDKMAKAATKNGNYPLLKLKLGGEGDDARLKAIRAAAPDARLIVDANEAWTPDQLGHLLEVAAETRVELIEQPLPAGQDHLLGKIERLVPICADESVHHREHLSDLAEHYDAVNIKLDKTGGLTEALAMMEDAKDLGLKIMTGCMVGTSLAMAPALLLAGEADWVDLDGPLLLEKDREPGLAFRHATIDPPHPKLWG